MLLVVSLKIYAFDSVLNVSRFMSFFCAFILEIQGNYQEGFNLPPVPHRYHLS